MENSGSIYQYVLKPEKGSRFVIGDIHGCADTLSSLVDKISPCKEDQIFFLVHAGFDFSKEKPFENTDSMLWLRKTEPDLEFLKSRRIIVGHQPVYIEEIEKAINSRAQIIPLDNGVPCVKKHRIYDFTRLGSLCCLNLDTFELITQKNIDM